MSDPEVERIMLHARQYAAQASIVMELIRILILSGVVKQELVVSSYERLSADPMKIGAAEGVLLADQVRDFAAGVERKPS